jgi:hypothetical protein
MNHDQAGQRLARLVVIQQKSVQSPARSALEHLWYRFGQRAGHRKIQDRIKPLEHTDTLLAQHQHLLDFALQKKDLSKS